MEILSKKVRPNPYLAGIFAVLINRHGVEKNIISADQRIL